MYLGIDLGTSGVKCVLMDDNQRIVDSHSTSLTVSRPHDSWSEQDPESWTAAIENSLAALKQTQRQALEAVRGIGLSGQQHGATLLDAAGQVIRPCMLWNDTRADEQAKRLDTDQFRKIGGNILFPGFTSPKVAWVGDNEPEAHARIAKVLLPKDYVRWWLTGEYAADMSDASGTGWLDIAARDWSDELLSVSGFSRDHMPDLVEGTAVSGQIRADLAARLGLSNQAVVAGGAGDNAASACGMGTVNSGQAFLSLGTSGVLFAANDRYRPNAESAVHAFCHALPDTWHQMGVILAATDSLNWLAKSLNQSPVDLTQPLEGTPADPVNVLFLPYLGGERTPINAAYARGAFIGLSHDTDQSVLVKAVLQGVAFAFKDSRLALSAAGTELSRAAAIGGGSRSDYWLQVLANAVGIPLDVSEGGDFGASLGAARLGMIAAESADPLAICTPPPVDRTFEPESDALVNHFADVHQRYVDAYRALEPVMAASSAARSITPARAPASEPSGA